MNVIYVSPNGIGTALVRSQVLPYLRGLAEQGVVFDLVTFERAGDPSAPPSEMPRGGWHPVPARPGAQLGAKVLDVLRGALTVLRVTLAHGPDLIHARSYLPAAIAWGVTRLTRRPYLFDMRGFLGDEYVDGRHWDVRDIRYRLLIYGERVLFRGAAGIVVLTEAAATRLRSDSRYAGLVASKPIMVTPCAVDLARFRPLATRSATPTLVYSGSLGMSYALDAMLRVYSATRLHVPELRFLILNRKEHALVNAAIARHGLEQADIVVRGAEFDEMAGLVGDAHVGICLLDRVSSKMASSPIKVGEYLACGLPVLVNAGQGDIDGLIRGSGAGHVLEDYGDSEIRRAAAAVTELLGARDSRTSARVLAENHFDLVSGVERYIALYREVSPQRRHD